MASIWRERYELTRGHIFRFCLLPILHVASIDDRRRRRRQARVVVVAGLSPIIARPIVVGIDPDYLPLQC